MRITKSLPAHPQSVYRAREFAVSAARDLGFSGNLHDLKLLVSELVTNVILHTKSDVEVEVSMRHRSLHIEVRDASPVKPHIRKQSSPGEASGRGLRLVNDLAAKWGIEVIPGDGKSIWFEVAA